MHVIATDLPDVLIIGPKLFGDQRGFFLETYQSTRYAEHGINRPFLWDNLPLGPWRAARGVLRGRVLDVAVDIRAGSPLKLVASNSVRD